MNGAIGSFFLNTFYESPMVHYLICTVFLLSEIFILFKGPPSSTLGVGLGSLIHLFVLRAIIFASSSLALNISMYEIFTDKSLYPLVNLASFLAQLITLTLFIKLMPLKVVKRIMDDKDFYTGLLSLAIIISFFLVFNSHMFLVDYFSVILAVQEISIAIFALAFLYIMLFLLIQIFNLGIYKEKTKELETKIDQDQSFASAVFSFAEVIIEVNCTQDKIVRLLINSNDREISHLPGLADFLTIQTQAFTHPDDVHIIQKINSQSLMADLQNGYSEKLLEFRSKKIQSDDVHSAVVSASDDYLWYRMRINTRLQPNSQEVFSLFTIDEIDEEKQAELSLKKQAETDPLTGSYNRAAFATKVQEYLDNGGCGTLYMFDLDNFKGINDNMGHSAGDKVLKEIYAKTTAIFRTHDIVSRVGGDEFLVFLSGTTKESLIKKKAYQICSDLNKTYHAENGVDIEISCSVGISVAPKDGTHFEALYDAADISMYHSKSIGKNTFTIYDSNDNVGFKPQEKEAYMRLRDTMMTNEDT